MNRIACSLPKSIRAFCESGCIYRDNGFKHLRCPLKQKTDTCVAPCSTCTCKATEVKKDTHKYYNEVRTLQEAVSN